MGSALRSNGASPFHAPGVGGFLETYRDANRAGWVAGATGPVSGARGRPAEVAEERGDEV